MLLIKPYMPVNGTVADAEKVMQRPGVADRMAQLTGSAKSALKTRLRELWGSDVAEVFLPRARPDGAQPVNSVWRALSRIVLDKIAQALETKLPLSEDTAYWTPERTSLASDAIHAHYKNTNSAAAMATKFRNILREFGAKPAVINATKRPEITTARNEHTAVRREERHEVGIEIPAPFENLAELKRRAEEFVAAPPTDKPTAQQAADFLVIWSARPGETATLRPGPGGGVVGALKKGGVNDEYPVASAVSPTLALQYLAAWRARPPRAIKTAMNALTNLVTEWGIKRPDLRAIGAELAVRAAKQEGRVKNAGQERTVRETALRHGPPHALEGQEEPQLAGNFKTATDFYTRVNDPTIPIAAKLAGAPVHVQAAVNLFLDASPDEQYLIIAAIVEATK